MRQLSLLLPLILISTAVCDLPIQQYSQFALMPAELPPISSGSPPFMFYSGGGYNYYLNQMSNTGQFIMQNYSQECEVPNNPSYYSRMFLTYPDIYYYCYAKSEIYQLNAFNNYSMMAPP